MIGVEESEPAYAEVQRSLPVAKEQFSIEENECYVNFNFANASSCGGHKSAITAVIVLVFSTYSALRLSSK